MTWIQVVTLIKLSILLMYSRIFRVDSLRVGVRKMNVYSICWYVTITFVLAWWLVYTIVCVCQCLPIHAFWTYPVPEGSFCVSHHSITTQGVQDIIAEIMILSLPIQNIWRMKLRLNQKILVSGVFALGGFVIAVSAVRLYYVAVNVQDPDLSCELLELLFPPSGRTSSTNSV